MIAVAVLTGGCETTPSRDLRASIDHYEDGDWADAREDAQSALRRTHGSEHDEAAYVSGLSAFRLGRLDEAATDLEAAAEASDAALAANAQASLALVRLEQNRPREASRLLAKSAPLLSGEDRAQAARFAAVAYRRAGDDRGAARWTDGAIGEGPFALQVGAFKERRRAERAADGARRARGAKTIGVPRVIPGTDGTGRSLYFVQLGRFASRRDADRARTRIGRPEYIVAPLAH